MKLVNPKTIPQNFPNALPVAASPCVQQCALHGHDSVLRVDRHHLEEQRLAAPPGGATAARLRDREVEVAVDESTDVRPRDEVDDAAKDGADGRLEDDAVEADVEVKVRLVV